MTMVFFTLSLLLRELEIPFEDSKQAGIAQRVLSPDPILRPQDFQVEYSTRGNILKIQFKSIDDRVLRVGVSNVIDSLKTIIEAIDELAGPLSV